MELEKNPKSIVHWMAYPGPGNIEAVMRGQGHPEALLETMSRVLDDDYFQAIEVTHIKSPAVRKRAATILKRSKKIKLFCCQPVQLLNEEGLIDAADISAISENERAKAVARIVGLLDEAGELGCSYVAVYSGKDLHLRQVAASEGWNSAGDPRELRDAQWRSLARSLREICAQAAERKSTVLLETFDRQSNADGRINYKGALAGPAGETAAMCETLEARGVNNFGLIYDSSHMILLGETPAALDMLAPWLKWVHIANAITDSRGDDATLRSGDMHPALGVAGSRLTREVLAEFVEKLIEIDYTGPIGFEIKPIKNEEPADVIRIAQAHLDEARNSLDAACVLRGGYTYSSRAFFSEDVLAEMTRLRVDQPDLIQKELQARKRRPALTKDGYLVILAADHPARLATSIPGDKVGMGDRLEFLGRIIRVLAGSNIDGVMGTADVIEDLALANYIYKKRHDGKNFLDGRLLVGCVNRGGLAGAVAELMDRETSYMSAKRLVDANLDAAKIMWRFPIDQHDPLDRYALETMERVAKFCSDCHDHKVPVMLEPIAVIKTKEGNYKFSYNPDDVIRMVGAANGLSHTTAGTWIKIPYTTDYARVVRSTTMPILMLGGESTGRPASTIENFARGMGSGSNVRGALVGRNVIFPGKEDPAVIAEAIQLCVHKQYSAKRAIEEARGLRGTQMELFA